MNKLNSTLDEAINRLNQILSDRAKQKTDSELLEILLSKEEWDNPLIELVKQEIKNRANR